MSWRTSASASSQKVILSIRYILRVKTCGEVIHMERVNETKYSTTYVYDSKLDYVHTWIPVFKLNADMLNKIHYEFKFVLHADILICHNSKHRHIIKISKLLCSKILSTDLLIKHSVINKNHAWVRKFLLCHQLRCKKSLPTLFFSP